MIEGSFVSPDNLVYTLAGGVFATAASYIASRLLKRADFNREDKRLISEAETKRVALLIEGYDRYARALEARIEALGRDLSESQADRARLWDHNREQDKALLECEAGTARMTAELADAKRQIGALAEQLADYKQQIDRHIIDKDL